MGSYAQCWLEDFQVGSSKNDIDPSLISLFRASDKRISLNQSGNVPDQLKHYQESQLEEPELAIVYYEATAPLIKDRLDVLGYTLETAEKAFVDWVEGEKSRLLAYVNESKEDSNAQFSLKEHYLQELEFISDLTPSNWLNALNKIRQLGLKANHFNHYKGPYENTLIGYMLSHDWYGFPGYDINIPLRLILEDAKQDEKLIYDVTGLIWGGYFDSEDDLVSYGLRLTVDEYSSRAKTIILTEGRTDTWVLKESLEILYPHLADYYSFLDFDNARIGGGVGNLSNIVKAFAGAGIVNNIVALFDNDTAAAAAIKNVERIELPGNIKILKLPELEVLKKYPTIGPSGEVLLDVNGIAASIELYFGEDVLRTDGVNLTPIQWTGFDASIKKYQGEVIEKKLLQDRFNQKLISVKQADNPSLDSTWDPLRSVLKLIFSAFENRQRKSICSLAAEYYSNIT